MLIEANKHIIRKFTVGDRILVMEFFDQMSGETRGFFNRNDNNRNNALSYFDKNGEEPSVVRFLSSVKDENDKEIMTGYIFSWEMDTSIPKLGIAVREEYKGLGLGRLLMKHLISYLEDNHYGGVMLTTSEANIRGKGLYSRMGFRHFGSYINNEMLYILRFKR